MHDLEWKNDLTQNESQSEIKCEFEFSCIVSDPHKTRTSFKNAQKCADEAEQVVFFICNIT